VTQILFISPGLIIEFASVPDVPYGLIIGFLIFMEYLATRWPCG